MSAPDLQALVRQWRERGRAASKGVMPSEPDLQAEATPPAERLQPLDALIAKYEATKGRGHMSSKDVFLAELVRLLAALREAETPQPNGS